MALHVPCITLIPALLLVLCLPSRKLTKIWKSFPPLFERTIELDISGGKINDAHLKQIENTIRSMIEHENTLMNYRIQWFLTITGFLITAVFLASGYVPSFLVAILSVLGFIVSLSFGLSLKIGRKAVLNLKGQWEYYKGFAPPGFPEIGVVGSSASKGWNRLAPWSLLPPVLACFWLLIAFASWHKPDWVRQNSTNTYIYVEPGKVPPGKDWKKKCDGKLARFHTGKGLIECEPPQ